MLFRFIWQILKFSLVSFFNLNHDQAHKENSKNINFSLSCNVILIFSLSLITQKSITAEKFSADNSRYYMGRSSDFGSGGGHMATKSLPCGFAGDTDDGSEF